MAAVLECAYCGNTRIKVPSPTRKCLDCTADLPACSAARKGTCITPRCKKCREAQIEKLASAKDRQHLQAAKAAAAAKEKLKEQRAAGAAVRSAWTDRVVNVPQYEAVFVPRAKAADHPVVATRGLGTCLGLVVEGELGVFFAHIDSDSEGFVSRIAEVALPMVGRPRHVWLSTSSKLPEMRAPDEPASKLPEMRAPDEPASKLPEAGAQDEPASKLPEVRAPDEPASKLPEMRAPDEPASKLPEAGAQDEPASARETSAGKMYRALFRTFRRHFTEVPITPLEFTDLAFFFNQGTVKQALPYDAGKGDRTAGLRYLNLQTDDLPTAQWEENAAVSTA